MPEMREVTVVGAGPGGIAASIYLKRVGFDPLLIERAEPGGLLRSANLVENYPGFPGGITGQKLASIFVRQLESLGVRLTKANVEGVRRVGDAFEIRSGAGEFTSMTVIMATGTRPRKIAIEGGEALEGSRLFYDLEEALSCDGRRFIIIGGGDSAFDYSINLHDRGRSAIVVSRSTPRCLPLLYERAEKRGIIIKVGLLPERVLESHGGIVLVGRYGDEVKELYGDAILIASGRVPNLEPLSPGLRNALRGSVPETGVPGLFLVGDVARGRCRQTGIAVGDGILAAMMIEDHFAKLRGGS